MLGGSDFSQIDSVTAGPNTIFNFISNQH